MWADVFAYLVVFACWLALQWVIVVCAFWFFCCCFQVRSGCAFMVHVCQDEHQLYNEFFSKPTPKLE